MPRFHGIALRALLLDLDDTILDSRRSLLGAWERVTEAIVEAYPELDAPRVHDQIARSTRWYWSDGERLRVGRIDLPRARHAILSHALEELGRPDAALARATERIYTAHRETHLTFLPGALEALGSLRARLPRLALVTNGAAAVQRAKVERFDLGRFFDAVVIEGELGAGKPESRVYGHTLERLGCAPGESLMAGDNYDADVVGALEAGLHAVWIALEPAAEPPPAAPRPLATLRSLAELAEAIEA